MPTMPLEREAAYNNWRKTFSDLQVENHLYSWFVADSCLKMKISQKREVKEERFASFFHLLLLIFGKQFEQSYKPILNLNENHLLENHLNNHINQPYIWMKTSQKREVKEERFASLSTTVAETSSNLSLNRWINKQNKQTNKQIIAKTNKQTSVADTSSKLSLNRLTHQIKKQ